MKKIVTIVFSILILISIQVISFAANPNRIAIKRWYVGINPTTSNIVQLPFTPRAVIFDGDSIWASGNMYAAKVRPSDGTIIIQILSFKHSKPIIVQILMDWHLMGQTFGKQSNMVGY